MASSLSPPEISMELHALNRAKVVLSLRDNLISSARPLQGFVFLQAIPSHNSLILLKTQAFHALLFLFFVTSLGRRRTDAILHGSCHTIQVIHLSFYFLI